MGKNQPLSRPRQWIFQWQCMVLMSHIRLLSTSHTLRITIHTSRHHPLTWTWALYNSSSHHFSLGFTTLRQVSLSTCYPHQPKKTRKKNRPKRCKTTWIRFLRKISSKRWCVKTRNSSLNSTISSLNLIYQGNPSRNISNSNRWDLQLYPSAPQERQRRHRRSRFKSSKKTKQWCRPWRSGRS